MFLLIHKKNENVPEIRKIHPYKQDIVANIYNKLKGTNTRLVIFGSSITDKCNQYSDLDICFEGKSSVREVIRFETNGNSDIFDIKDVNPTNCIYNNIMNGVEIIC